MAESMSSPWIRDYLVDVAETYGAQLYNAPQISSARKKVQLTDFLTYQGNSYVWAWISDKDHRVSVRISKDAADAYKSRHSRNIIDCRFSLVVVSGYRPMFSPRPLGPYTTGNTPISHLSLEIGQVRLIGVGGHLFGNPCDLELDENLKDWISGLRQDGGGGNILKLRKQQQVKKAASSPSSPPPFSLYAPVSQCPAAKDPEDVTKPKAERPEDLKRTYAKRWRKIEVDPWKLATRPEEDEHPNACPGSPPHTPSSASKPQQQGTPTDWSLSRKGSPVVSVGSEIREHDEGLLSIAPLLLSDTEGHTVVDAVFASDDHSLQPPTPAQRTRRSPRPTSTSPSLSSPEILVRCSYPSQLPSSYPPPPSSSLPLPPPSLQMLLTNRKNIQRKVPHPGLPVTRPEPTNQASAQILVPNSDTSGAGSSQPCLQSQHPSQSQRSQHQLLSHLPAFPSSLTKDFEPLDASTPRDAQPGSSARRTPRMLAQPLLTHPEIDGQDISSKDVQSSTEKSETNIRKEEGSNLAQVPPGIPNTDVLEVGTSDTEEETEQLQLTRSAVQLEVNDDRRDDHVPVDKVEVQAASHSGPLASDKKDVSEVSIQHSPLSPKPTMSRSPMHLLFSSSSGAEQITLSHSSALPVDRKEDRTQGKMTPALIPRHDPETWREPSFLARSKGKGKSRAVEEPEILSKKAGKKRQRSAQLEPPVPKRARITTPELRQVVSGQSTVKAMQRQGTGAPANGKTHSNDQPSSFSRGTTETISSAVPQSSRSRLASFVIDFERIDSGKRAPIPKVDMEKGIRGILLRTGRLRTLGEKAERDGKVYLMDSK